MNPQNPPQCECHECTQIRWRMSLGGQLSALSGAAKKQDSSTFLADECYRKMRASQNFPLEELSEPK